MLEILNEFSPKAIDLFRLEEIRKIGWQRQLHLLKAFYYIEMVLPMGAIGL